MDYRRIVNQVVVGVAVAVLAAAPAQVRAVVCENAKLWAWDGAGYAFGGSVSVSGDVAVAGAAWDAPNGEASGSAYVFRWNGSSWTQEQKLLPSDGAAWDHFGGSVSVSGDVAVVGAHWNDDNGPDSGSAYVYRWNGSSWVQEQKLLASDGEVSDLFGISVSVSGDVAVVGAHLDDDACPADPECDSGSAYVFRWSGSSWVQEQKLLASDGEADDLFGRTVSVSGDVAVVGTSWVGSVYVFRWNGSSWVQEQKLLPSDGELSDRFGLYLSVSEDVAVVGAPRDDDDNGTVSGAAYVFRWNGSSWVQEQKLLASDGAEKDRFGGSISVSGDVAVVGARLDDDACPDDPQCNSGSAYLFRWNGSSWVQEQKLLASDGAAGDNFGNASVSGDVVVVGSPIDNDNSAYVFRTPWIPCSVPCPWDINGDGEVGYQDFMWVLSEFQDCWGFGCAADIDGDYDVDIQDFLLLLAHWGPCPD